MNAREIPYLAISRLELVVVADHPVDVVPEVQVRVEDVGARGDQAAQLRRRTRPTSSSALPRASIGCKSRYGPRACLTS